MEQTFSRLQVGLGGASLASRDGLSESCCHEGSGVGLHLSPALLCHFSFPRAWSWLARGKGRFSPWDKIYDLQT